MYFSLDLLLRSHYWLGFESLCWSIELESSCGGADLTCLIDLKVEFTKLSLFDKLNKLLKEGIPD
jgi:hypothetical protein